jgi:hypothetical protein
MSACSSRITIFTTSCILYFGFQPRTLSAFDGFPKEEVYFARGKVPPERMPAGSYGPDRGAAIEASPVAAGQEARRQKVTQLGSGVCIAWRSMLVSQRSEIRLVSSRYCGVFFGAVFMRVFGADALRPVAEYAPIGFGRRPSGCEDAFVLDRKLEL